MYKIYMFDGLILPEYLPEGGSNDIGSGDALTSFSQLPGGGFVDNYGQRVSPQNIRPITRECVLWADTADELYEKFNAVRGKIGKRGKLTVMFDNGQMWWQWARLQRVHMPRSMDAKANWLTCGLTFITASQNWYGLVQTAEGWEVGDDTFYLGDGSAALGMQDHVFNVGFPAGGYADFLTTEGSTYVRNMRVEMQLDQNIAALNLQILNMGHRIVWTNPSITGGWTLIMDTGEKSCRVRHDTSAKAIASVSNYGATMYVVTTTAHGRSTGDSVEIAGSTNYSGVYHNIVVVNALVFTVDKLPERELPETEIPSGAVYWLQDTWANLTVYDRTNWLLMAPGENQFSFNYTNNGGLAQIQDYMIRFNWYDHFR
jgi:hypothetical protein